MPGKHHPTMGGKHDPTIDTVRAFIDSDDGVMNNPVIIYNRSVLMPVRAFIDSDHTYPVFRSDGTTIVLMPVRAFIDSDRQFHRPHHMHP